MPFRAMSRDAAMFLIGGTAFAVFTTGTAVSVTTTAVAITDATSGKRAHVTNLNSLVTSQRDPYSGVYQRVDAGGAGIVSVLPSRPWNMLDGETVSGSSPTAMIAQATSPTRIALTSLTLTATGGAGTVRLQVALFPSSTSGGDCSTRTGATFTIAERFDLVVPTGTTQHLTWPVPLVWSAYGQSGHKVCMDIDGYSGPASWAVNVYATGFYV